MLDNIVQITPNDAASTNLVSSQLDPKTLQLIQKLVDRPLLLEKLLISESQGILLKTAFKGEKLSLQLPLSASRVLSDINANNQSNQQPIVQLTINGKQQIKLVITVPVAKQPNQPSASRLSSAKSKEAIASNANAVINSKLPPEQESSHKKLPQEHNLQSAKNQISKSNQNTLQGSASTSQVAARANQKPMALASAEVITTKPDSRPNQNRQNSPNIPNSQSEATRQRVVPLLFKQANVATNKTLILRQPIALTTADNITNSSQLAQPTRQTQTQTVLGTTSKGTIQTSQAQAPLQQASLAKVDNIVRQLLRQNFAQQLPLSKYVEQLNQSLNTIKAQKSSSVADKSLITQLTNLVSSLNRPEKPTANAIKQRILSSGHQLENQITKTGLITETLTGSKSNKSAEVRDSGLPGTSITNRTQAIDPLNSPKPPINDLKLQLLQVKSQIESIIRSLVNNATGSTQSNQASSPSPSPSSLAGHIANPLSNSSGQANPATSGQANPEQFFIGDNKPSKSTDRNWQQSGQNNQPVNVSQLTLKQANELLNQVKAFVSQIESNQLLSLRNEQPNIMQFLVDLPFAHQSKIDSFELLFESRQNDKDSKNNKHWKVVVRFDLPPLGPMFAQVELKNERLSSNIFAESEQTAQLLNEHLHVLKKSLFSAGVDIDELTGNQGHVPTRLKDNNEPGIDTHV